MPLEAEFRQSGAIVSGSVMALRSALLGASALVLLPAAAMAQSGSYILGPGSDVGKETRIEESNCVTAADGSVTCDTKIVNPPGQTRARPQFEPFSNEAGACDQSKKWWSDDSVFQQGLLRFQRVLAKVLAGRW